jgi:hypothetical protein
MRAGIEFFNTTVTFSSFRRPCHDSGGKSMAWHRARPELHSRLACVTFLTRKVALGHDFLEVLLFDPLLSFLRSSIIIFTLTLILQEGERGDARERQHTAASFPIWETGTVQNSTATFFFLSIFEVSIPMTKNKVHFPS